MGTLEARNKQLVERYWDALARRDWDRMASMLAPDAHYTDVGTPGPGGTGPEGVMARLRIGLEPLSGYWHYPSHIVAEGDLVFTEHVEHWEFHTGEAFDHPFVSVIEIRDGLIVRWHDYSNIANVLQQAPRWWLEHIGVAQPGG
jgi:ketosteroid isomerase-like protein